jgi:O-antigen/teichoic acid export membrane protein
MNVTAIKSKLQTKTSAALMNTAWLASEKVVSMALALLINISIARVFGPELFGEFSYLFSLAALLGPIGALGINSIVTREVINNPNKTHEIIASSIFVRFLGAAVVFCISLSIWFEGTLLSNLSNPDALLLLSFAGVFTSLQVIEFWYQAKVVSKDIVKWRIPVVLMFAAAKFCVLWIGGSFKLLVAIYAVELVVMGAVILILYSNKESKVKFSDVNISYGLSLFKQSIWLLFSGIASLIYLKIDQVMLGQMTSNANVGVYAVASRLSEVWYFFPEALMASFFASLLIYKNNFEEYYRRIQTLCDGLFTFALILAVLVTVLSDQIIHILYGAGYEESSVILSIHIWAGCFVFMRALLSKWLIAENLLQFSLLSHGLGAIVNVALNYWMIQEWQGTGAALATVISYAIASYFALFIYKPTRKMAYIMTRSIFLPARIIVIAPDYFWKRNR